MRRSRWNLPRSRSGKLVTLGFWSLVAGVLIIVGCARGESGADYSPNGSLTPVSIPTIPSPPPRSGLVEVSDKGYVSGTVHGPCHLRGQSPQTYRPDRHCTPGSYDPTITARKLCSPGYTTDSYRPPESQTERFKYEVAEPAYGEHVTGELDHFIPLELAGSNDATNLWVEPGSYPNPKDAVENALHDWVCQNPTQARLRAAQVAIAMNWATAERKLGI